LPDASTYPIEPRAGAAPGEPLPPEPPLLLNRRAIWMMEQ
jgi:hypothetical protein